MCIYVNLWLCLLYIYYTFTQIHIAGYKAVYSVHWFEEETLGVYNITQNGVSFTNPTLIFWFLCLIIMAHLSRIALITSIYLWMG